MNSLLLPIVNSEIGFSLAEYIGEIPDKEFVIQELKKIKRENPVIEEFIRRWTLSDKNRIHTAFCGILVYKLLKSQAEVDQMNKELKYE